MKILIILILLLTLNIKSAEFKIDAYGYDKSKLYTLSEKHIYVVILMMQ